LVVGAALDAPREADQRRARTVRSRPRPSGAPLVCTAS
jgi:hypothetical protein